jgi:hypothetical protein
MNWINLAQDRDPWNIHVNVVMNFRVRECREILCSAKQLLD